MNHLRQLQIDFSHALLLSGASTAVDHDAVSLIQSGNLTVQQRLNIYRNNCFHSLTEALADVYPVIKRLVGDEFFYYLAEQYIKSHPSRSGNLHEFGAALSAFLQRFQPTQVLVYLPDVARLEWAYHQAFHAADIEPLDSHRMVKNALSQAERLRFSFNPACALIESDYPIVKIWQANQGGVESEEVISLDEGGVKLLVNRNEFDIQFHCLSLAEYKLLTALWSNCPFLTACETALQVEPNIDLSQVLFNFVQQCVLVSYRID